MIGKLDNAIFFNDYIVFGDIDSDFVTFFINDIGLNSISLEILMMISLIIAIQKLLIILGFWVGIINLNNTKHLRKR